MYQVELIICPVQQQHVDGSNNFLISNIYSVCQNNIPKDKDFKKPAYFFNSGN